jgi:hypothetical protein
LGFAAVVFTASSTARRTIEQGRTSASAFYYAKVVHAAASNIHPSIGGCGHIAHHAATGRNGGAREFFTLRIKLNNGIGLTPDSLNALQNQPARLVAKEKAAAQKRL